MHIFSHTWFPSSHHGTCSCSFSGSKFSPHRGNSTSHQIMSAKFLETFQKKWPLGWGNGGGQENRRRCNGFNKVSLPPWWLIDIVWHLLPCSDVINSSYRPRSRKGGGCGMGQYWLVFTGKSLACCCQCSGYWKLDLAVLLFQGEVTFPDTHPGMGGCSPETWKWIRTGDIHLKMYPFWYLRELDTLTFLTASMIRGWKSQSPRLVQGQIGRVFKDKEVMVCLWFQYPRMSPAHLVVCCTPRQYNAEGTLEQTPEPDSLGSKPHPATQCVTLGRLINLSVLWFPHQ